MGFIRSLGRIFLSEPAEAQDNGDKPNGAEDQPKGTLLAIDDDTEFLETLRMLLRAEGFNVLTASTGSKGLHMLCYAPGDIQAVLLDYNMPELNGAETLNHLRKLRPDIRVVAVTGIDLNRLPPSFRNGVDKFIQKPFKTTELLEYLGRIVHRTTRMVSP